MPSQSHGDLEPELGLADAEPPPVTEPAAEEDLRPATEPPATEEQKPLTNPRADEELGPAMEPAADEELAGEIEVVDGLPVVSGEQAITKAAALPAVQTAAAAATGFMVGAATLALLRRRDSRRLSRELRDLRRRVDPVRRVTEPAFEPGRSYLVHVRVFSRPPFDPRA